MHTKNVIKFKFQKIIFSDTVNYSKKPGLFKEQNAGFSAQIHSVTLTKTCLKKDMLFIAKIIHTLFWLIFCFWYFFFSSRFSFLFLIDFSSPAFFSDMNLSNSF